MTTTPEEMPVLNRSTSQNKPSKSSPLCPGHLYPAFPGEHLPLFRPVILSCLNMAEQLSQFATTILTHFFSEMSVEETRIGCIIRAGWPLTLPAMHAPRTSGLIFISHSSRCIAGCAVCSQSNALTAQADFTALFDFHGRFTKIRTDIVTRRHSVAEIFW
jgi:hypothetical protein